MDVFLRRLAEILDEEEVGKAEELGSFVSWDSLSVLSIIAVVDKEYSVNLHASDVTNAKTAADLWSIIKDRQGK